MDRVVIEKLVVEGYVGVSDAERAAPQRLRIDADVAADLAAAGETDDLGKSVDYGALVDLVLGLCATVRPRLLETLAERITQAIFTRFGPSPDRKAGAPGVVTGVRLRVVKLDPPLQATAEGLGVEIVRTPGRRGGGDDRMGFR